MFEELFTESAHQVMIMAAEATYQLRHSAIGTEHILIGLAREERGIAGVILREFGVTPELILNELRAIHGDVEAPMPRGEVTLPYSPRAKKNIMDASNTAKRLGARQIGTEHLLLAMLPQEILATLILRNLDVDLDALKKAVYQAIGIDKMPMGQSKPQARTQKASETAPSKTPTLDSFARNLTQMAKQGQMDPVVGREKEVQRMLQIISRRKKNNPVLVGDPGVDKTALA